MTRCGRGGRSRCFLGVWTWPCERLFRRCQEVKQLSRFLEVTSRADLEQAEDTREPDKPHGHDRQQVAARAGKEEETASHIARKQAWFKKKLVPRSSPAPPSRPSRRLQMSDSSESEDEDREKHRREEEKPRARINEDEDDSSEEEHEELMSRVLGKSNKVEQEEAKRTNHRDVAANFIKVGRTDAVLILR